MKYALTSSVHVDHLEATTFHCGGVAILTFKGGILNGSLCLHIPPAVADATAAAFNKAMAEHEAKTASVFPAPESRSVDGLAEW